MENKNTMKEIIEQAKQIEDNNYTNMEHAESIGIMLSSSDLGSSKDKNLTEQAERLKRQARSMRKLTSDLLDSLNNKHN